MEECDSRIVRLHSRRSMLCGAAAALSAAASTSLPVLAAEAKDAAKPLRLFKSEEGRARFAAAYDKLLKEWPLEFESLHISTRFGSTHVIASGPLSAPPVLLLPALMTTAGMWQQNVVALSAHFRTYAVDTLGEPNRSEPIRSQRNRHHCAEWMTDLMDGLQIARASFVGSSLGGFRAFNQALTTPERVERVVMISPPVFPLTWRFYWYAALGVMGSSRLDEWMGNGIPFNSVNQSWADVYAAAMSEGRLVNDLALGKIEGEEVGKLTIPTLLLIGDKEVIYDREPQEVIERAQARSPSLLGELVPNANHLASMVNPEAVNKRILEFLLPVASDA